MSLDPGARIGAFSITGPIGAGGMGEVYRARDGRLNRDVAIKVLPELFALDADRLARFEREAQVLASLNHPNIAHVYGVEHAGTTHALVMELVEGEDLSQRIARGALPLDEVLALGRQIADGLEAAHERGIVHRDLKPANIKVRDDGTVKVLDFGLAKALDPAAGSNPDLMHSPTLTARATQMGTIMGTAAYTSPEQARGRAVDRRADVWAFGCVLYEMLTGRRAFVGDDVSLTLAAVLKEDADFTALPEGTPAPVRRLVRRCLQKDPRRRLSAIGDARLELDDAATEPGDVVVAAGTTAHGWRQPLVWAAGGGLLALAIGAAAMTVFRVAPEAAAVVRSEIGLASTPVTVDGYRTFQIDPSGTEIVFVSEVPGQPSRLFRRRLSDDSVVVIAGTEYVMGPFFSPDGQWLGFIQQGRLKKMPAGGGGAVDLGDAGASAGGSFLADGSLILNPNHGDGLFRVPAAGGERTVLTTVAHDKGEAGHHWPHVLPDGRHVLFTVELDGRPYSDARVELVSLESGERRVLIEGGTDARYLHGRLLYWREGDIWSVPFDLSRLAVTGTAMAVLRNVMLTEPNGNAHFAVAGNGTAVYLSGRDPQEEAAVLLVNRNGVARTLTTERRAFESVAVSPDGRRLAATIVAANDSLWTMDLERPSLTRITFEAENSRPVWSPDGERLVLTRYRGGEARRLFVMPADGGSPPEMVRDSGGRTETAESWSVDNLLAFVRVEPTGPDIWVVELEGERQARPFLATRFAEQQPRFSADGKWIAYTSDESGRVEVYVRPFPGPGQKRLVSNNGGTEPRWRSDGREIFYRNGDAVLAVGVTPGAVPSFSLPRTLFTGSFEPAGLTWSTWDVMPDGQSFLLIQNFGQPQTRLSLAQGWFDELKDK